MRYKLYNIFCLLSTLTFLCIAAPITRATDTELFSQSKITSENVLPEDQAFSFYAQLLPNKNLELSWYIADGYYLYAIQFKVFDSDNRNILQQDTLPPAETVKDPDIGDYQVYSKQLVIEVPWQESFFDNSLIIEYQGCKADGFCYLPINKLIHINPDLTVTTKDTNLSRFPTSAIEAARAVSSTDEIAAGIANRNILITMVIFFGLGLLLTFTPCVLPMIPLVINLIVGPKQISTHKAMTLSGAYVIGMAGSYAIAGLFVGYLGATLQAWMQQTWVLTTFSIMLFALALNQFGVLRINLPHFNSSLNKWRAEKLQGSIVGALMLGIISALIVSPCITPPLIGALTYISQDGSPLVGGLTLLSLGLGMGVPLIIVAVLSSRVLPKAGAWMQLVKYITGLALIGLAIWLLLRISPVDGSDLPWKQVTNLQELNNAVQSDKYSLVDFYADWCISCKKIDANVFADPKMQKNLTSYNLIRIDLTNITNAKKQMLETLGIYGPPIILFYSPSGEEIRNARLAGEISIQDLEQALRKIE